MALDPAGPAAPDSPAEPPGDTASNFTVRYHRGRLLALAAVLCALWLAAADDLLWDLTSADFFSGLLAGGSVIAAYLSFHEPYLVFDTADRTVHGPGAWGRRRRYTRRGRPVVATGVRGGRLTATDGERERRMPFHRFWANAADWAELSALLADETRPAPPDWIRVVPVNHLRTSPGRLLIAPEAVHLATNRRLFRWALGIGLALWIAPCVAAPLLPVVADHYALFAFAPMVLIILGLNSLLSARSLVYEPRLGTVTARSRVFPRPKFDHLEYSGRLRNLYEVRADGTRRLVAPGWTMEPKEWQRFAERLQGQVR